LLVPLRPSPVLAKTVATLDVMSSGRVDLGIGVGWQREEYVACGFSWSQRHDRLDRVIADCRDLWGEQPVSTDGRNPDIEGLIAFPRPVQNRIPILYGVAATPVNVERIATLGDGWCPVQVTPDELARGVEAMRVAFKAEGRDPADLQVRMTFAGECDEDGHIDVARTVAAAPPFIDAGATSICIGPRRCLVDLDHGRRLVHELADAGEKLG
jgi:alkanesulfonate monooxygenase SsuD/methylene tetrahydromethanopterin reductase-like flavin-dependent oxidoreductase (luciferase family)